MRRLLRKLTTAANWPVAAVAAACILALSVYAVHVLEARLMKERQDKIRATVEIVHGVVARYGKLAEAGETTREEAQRSALEMARTLRYGRGDYFWIQDQSSRMLMHPILPELEGKEQDVADSAGKFFFREFRAKATGPDRGGYVAYLWPRPGSKVAVRKLAFVKAYEPWGWIVGSGAYLDDLDATMAGDGRRVYGAALIVAALLVAVGLGSASSMRRARRLEMELSNARKLEAVGQLAAGIAHEINTPIQFIGDNTHFQQEAFTAMAGLWERQARILEGASLPPAIREALARAAEEAELLYFLEQVPKTLARTSEGVRRVAAIVRAMKEFSHPDRREMMAADINRALDATLEVARNEYKYVADVEIACGEIPPVVCYAGELNQVFLNVIMNAAHAIADVVKGTGKKGKIRIRTRREGPDVVVDVSDTGGGIPKEISHRVFEPFFTTKEVGRGTGQGLAIARSIVRKHRGTITFETEPGQGTTFVIRVPIDGPGKVRGEAG